ncbi:MAG: leucine--tRNA ligase [Bacilli bacterium]|nr:leucine--tRNA ligase [Bacilli bacterium]
MYNFKEVEKKWQKYWENNNLFVTKEDFSKKKYYSLVEFPYPSGNGMHIGHIKAYMGLEVLSRMKRMQGYNVLFPIGFDAFGLPTENYAIKTNTHPRKVTDDNILKFTNQLKSIGFSFDFSRAIDTTNPDYYKFTQWIFLKLFENGLVFKNKTYVNYCPNCKVVLSNEDSQGGKCDICHNDVIQKEKEVWYLKITDYADKLLEGLNEVDFLPQIKLQQENWIGKSKGAYVNFKLKETDELVEVYTTRPDTLFGVTFMVIAPEHPLINSSKDIIKNIDEINNYKSNTLKKTAFERVEINKDKTGVKIDGLTAINPLNNKEIPIYVADYVMMNYGTGAIMAVPAHDSRDYDFAKKYNVEVIPVIINGSVEKTQLPYEEDGIMINSDFLNGIDNKNESINKMIEYLKNKGIGKEGVQYKLNDWAFNRQRYWGEPIPLIHCPKCGTVGVPYEELPLKLPEINDFEPGTDGESPLAKIDSFVNCKCPICGELSKRETDTMPQWAGSSWYYLRYIDPFNNEELANKDKLKYWLPVDWYNGGMEHVTRHLIYSRFWHRFLYDIGYVPVKEPFLKRTAQGLILGPDGEKMSKSRGNVVDPSDVINAYGADVLRMYILFMGDYSLESPWDDSSIKGISRFLDRVYNLKDRVVDRKEYTSEFEAIINKTIKKVSSDIENIKYNTAISELMKLTNEYYKNIYITKSDYYVLLKLLYPFAPHICEELNELINNKESLVYSEWPSYDESKIVEDSYDLIVQVNGKIRGKIEVNINISEEEMKQIAFNNDNVKKYIDGKDIIKIIVVKNKLLNIVIKE